MNDIRSLDDALADFAVAWESGQPRSPVSQVAFATPELMDRLLDSRRRALLKELPATVEAIADRLGQSVVGVRADMQALVTAGLVCRSEDGVYGLWETGPEG